MHRTRPGAKSYTQTALKLGHRATVGSLDGPTPDLSEAQKRDMWVDGNQDRRWAPATNAACRVGPGRALSGLVLMQPTRSQHAPGPR